MPGANWKWKIFGRTRACVVLKFRGVDSMTDAEALIGSELQVPSAERAQLDRGWNYVSDLVGCIVFDRGREIGRIEDVQFGAGEAPLLMVAARSGKKFDVPFAEAYLESVDVAQRQVRMNLPEGMLRDQCPHDAGRKAGSNREDKEAYEISPVSLCGERF